jgi:hypothetical protein
LLGKKKKVVSLILATAIISSCSFHKLEQFDTLILARDYSYCFSLKDVKVYSESITKCPNPLDLQRDIDFVVDYAHAPDSSIKELNLIFESEDIACAGIIAEGCSDPFLMTSVIVDNYSNGKIRSITRHELYHIVLWKIGQSSDDVLRDKSDIPMRKDWADIEKGPL